MARILGYTIKFITREIHSTAANIQNCFDIVRIQYDSGTVE